MNNEPGIPWNKVIQFHKDITSRAEKGFFSFDPVNTDEERWTGLSDFRIDEIDGPWGLSSDSITSRGFRIALENQKPETIFLGGPCFLGSENIEGSGWLPRWQPLLYREVIIDEGEEGTFITPESSQWHLNPQILSMAERREISLSEDIDVFIDEIIRKAALLIQSSGEEYGPLLLETFTLEVPGLRNDLRRESNNTDVKHLPGDWVLFTSTNKFSAINRYMMKDYEAMENIASQSGFNPGGLRIFDFKIEETVENTIEPLPVVPLNDEQREAVKEVLGKCSLSVISGPPGCGKSQVVVSILMNAWAQGKSVLFASNNNKAVDVVRERLMRFESEFPIAVRAGNKLKRNISEVLKQTLFMASSAGRYKADAGRIEAEREKKLKEYRQTRVRLDSRIPHRIKEYFIAALSGYEDTREMTLVLDNERKKVLDEFNNTFGSSKSPDSFRGRLEATRKWASTLPDYRQKKELVVQKHSQLENLISESIRRRNSTTKKIGTEPETLETSTWYTRKKAAVELQIWLQNSQLTIQDINENTLKPISWSVDFERWSDSVEAAECRNNYMELAQDIRQTIADSAPIITLLDKLEAEYRNRSVELRENGLEAREIGSINLLIEWTDWFARSLLHQESRWDILPWSSIRRITRHLYRLEKQFYSFFPISKWKEIRLKGDEGRDYLSSIIEVFRKWHDSKLLFEKARKDAIQVEQDFNRIRTRSMKIDVRNLPDSFGINEWKEVELQCRKSGSLADKASIEWLKRSKQEESLSLLKKIEMSWNTLYVQNPLKLGWVNGEGLNFQKAISSLGSGCDVDSFRLIKTLLNSGILSSLIDSWRDIENEQELIS